MNVKPVLLLVVAAAVTVAAAVRYAPQARRGTPGDLPELIELVPADSTLVAYADLAALRGSPLVQRLAAITPAANVDRDYADFVRATGFDYQKDLDAVVVASHGGTTLALAMGRFDQDKIEQYALRSAKPDDENGHAVYRVPSATPGRSIALAFLDKEHMAISDGGDLSSVLSASRPQLDPVMRERLSRVAGTPLFAVAKTPGVANTPAAGRHPAPASTTLLQSLRWVSFAARPDGSEIYLSAEGECDTSSQAESVAAGIELLRGVLGSAMADPKAGGKMSAAQSSAVHQLLSAARVTTDATRVRLLLTLTPEMLGVADRSPDASAPVSR